MHRPDDQGDSSTYEAAKRLVRLATDSGVTVGCAESCTGGLVCAAITDVPGSSAVLRGGVVSYAVPVKESVLGVPEAITRNTSVGVVSGECASAMCEGARKVLGCDIAVATTGIAGPAGAEPGKPVGTVWFGVSTSAGTQTRVRLFSGTRKEVRRQAVREAIELVIEALGA